MDLRELRMTTRLLEQAKQNSMDNGSAHWYRIENKANTKSAEIYIMDEIGYFGITADEFVRDLNKVAADNITLHISTPGGEVFDAVAIYNALKDHKASVDVVIEGIAASAGSFIAMAGDTVKIQRNASMMIHDGRGLVIGNAQDMRKTADVLDKVSDNIADIYAQRSKQHDKEYFRKKMKDETWYNSNEALDEGLVDEVLGSDEPVENTATEVVNTLDEASDAEFEFDVAGMLRALKEAL